MRPIRTAFLAAAMLIPASQTFAAARLTYSMDGAPTPVAWTRASFPIRYTIDRRVLSTLGDATVAASFSAWTSVPDSNISFEQSGVGDGLKAGRDEKNTLSMLDGLFKDQGFIAVTTNWYETNGKMIEADIQLDATLVNSGYNVQQTLEHEVGHLLGLDHSAVLTSVMYPYVSRSKTAPQLDSDDRVVISSLYAKQDPALTGGTITGRVTGNSGGIFAAQVVAVNENGEPVATSLSNVSGDFVLQGLPRGNYRVYAEPLDGPVDPRNLDGIWRSAKSESFRTQFASGGTRFVDNGTVAGNVMVSAVGAPVALNPRWLGVSPAGSPDFTLSSTPVTVRGGETISIAVAGDGFTSGMTTFEIMNPGVKRVSDFRYAANFAYATFAVSADAPSGSAVIMVTSGNDSATLTGGLRIEAGAAPQRLRIVRK